jgi:asparagine synthase (glutamine-hydrolysing)
MADCVLNGMTFFTKSKLLSRAKVLLSLSQVPGSIVEAGVALGGTAIFATKIAHGRPVHLYDVFGMIPRPDDEKDTHDAVRRYKEIKAGKAQGFGNQTYYGYEQDLLSKVKANYDACQVPMDCVSFHKGLVEQTMKDINFRVAYLHCDTDFYSAVYHCLVDGAPHISLNGYIVIDDYFSYGSARNAVHDYFKINGSNYRNSRNQEFQAFKSNVLMLKRIA